MNGDATAPPRSLTQRIFNQIRFDNLKGDLFGGLTTAIVSLPLALAFGVAAFSSFEDVMPGAGPIAGLYGAVCVGLFAALFGGTATLISEPTGPMTVVMTSIMVSMAAKYPTDPEKAIAIAFTVVMLAGIFQILFGAFRLGEYVTLMPYSVISGFMSGIGVILIILQIAPLLGQSSPKGGVLGTLQALPDLVSRTNPVELILGLMTIALIFLMPSQWKRYVPPQLLALVIGTIVSLTLFGDVEMRRIGAISTGMPSLKLPTFTAGDVSIIFVDAAILGMLGCIDTLLTAVIADSVTRTQHDSNKELIGQGLGNLVSGLCGGLPGAGATMGTVVNIQTGARSALSGITRALILLVVVLWAAPLTASIPMAVLAGIALKVGIDILDWSFLQRSHQVSVKGSFIMYGVLLLTVLVDLIVAVGVGVFIANILTIDKLSKLHGEEVKTITDADDAIQLSAEEKALMDQTAGQVLLFYLSGPMIFGLAKAIAREHAAMRDAEVLILDLTDVPHLGVTASLSLENVVKDALGNDRKVLIVGAKGQTRNRLEKLKVLNLIEPNHLCDTRTQAFQFSLEMIRGADEPNLSLAREA